MTAWPVESLVRFTKSCTITIADRGSESSVHLSACLICVPLGWLTDFRNALEHYAFTVRSKADSHICTFSVPLAWWAHCCFAMSSTRVRLVLNLTTDTTDHTCTQYTHNTLTFTQRYSKSQLVDIMSLVEIHRHTECTVNAAVLLYTYHDVFHAYLHREEGQVSHSSCAQLTTA